jgi:hypothetical protein
MFAFESPKFFYCNDRAAVLNGVCVCWHACFNASNIQENRDFIYGQYHKIKRKDHLSIYLDNSYPILV